jgi:hypothetical protein
VRGPVGIRALQDGLIPTRDVDPGLQLIGHEQGGDAPQKGQGPTLALEKVRGPLRRARLGIGVIGRPQDRDEELDGVDDAGRGVDDRGALARVIEKQLLAGVMDLAHRAPLAGEPRPVLGAKGGVAKPVRMGLEIFQVQELERHPHPPELRVDPGGVRPRPADADRCRRASVELRVEGPVGEGRHRVPGPAEVRGSTQDRRHGPRADAQALRGLPVRSVERPFQAQNLANLSHG